MEFKSERLVPALMLTTALLLGGVACSSEASDPDKSQAEQLEQTESYQDNENSDKEYTAEEVLDGISRVEFFATPLEYAALEPHYEQPLEELETDAITLLNNRGISVTNYNAPPTDFLGNLPVVNTAKLLAKMPCRLVEASGLRQIILVEPKDWSVENREYHLQSLTPIAANGMVEIDGSSFDITTAMAALILEKVPESQEVIKRFEEITQEAGAEYDPSFNVRYKWDEDGEFMPNPDFPEEYKDIFDNQETVFSAQIEFIYMFNSYLNGLAGEHITEPSTPMGQKQVLLIDLYNHIVGDNGSTLRFIDLTMENGTHNLHPLDNLVRLRAKYDDLRAAETEEERDRIDHDNDFERGLYDPSYPNNLEIFPKPSPVPCLQNMTTTSRNIT